MSIFLTKEPDIIYEVLEEDVVADGTERIYIFIVSSKTLIGSLIKYVTNQNYTHVSLSLDDTLKNMYSFNILDNGFVRENIYEYDGSCPMSLYYIDVTKESKITIQNKIEEIRDKQNRGLITYSKLNMIKTGLVARYRSLITKLSPDNSDDKNSFICSEFVTWILDSIGIKVFSKRENKFIAPHDFIRSRATKKLYRGTIKGYIKRINNE
jgi:hypothetical protein